jgi:hypothetical protein
MDEIDVWTGPKDHHFIVLRRTTLGMANFTPRCEATKSVHQALDAN